MTSDVVVRAHHYELWEASTTSCMEVAFLTSWLHRGAPVDEGRGAEFGAFDSLHVEVGSRRCG
jgi:hypothetical protein